ncbi:hypothetical protein LPJ61_005678 [Coemansia biformis]|uniref:Uncharacterized protein n=1 Tax=Coemansia biformis TaxID=1286918 RepID=A0A9W7Y6W4_9FUNG|nr:hypothetical protein LPJ61_005678 [Coemansia biformis]
MTTTNVVVISEFITEDDTNVNALYTFGDGIQTRGQLSTTLGPYAKPLFGTNVGLTIAPDPAVTSTSDPSSLVFTGDWPAAAGPSASTRQSGSEATNLIAPSLAPPPAPSRASTISVDLWPTSSHSTDSAYPAGTPLFTGPSPSPTLDSAAGPTLAPAEATGRGAVAGFLTNRPSFKSVTDQAQADLAGGHHGFLAARPRATTKFNTVTVSGKPMLQVVVSADNTAAIPENLTISY